MFRISPSGEVEDFVTSSRFNGSIGLDYDKVRDRFYVTNWDGANILIVERNGSITTLLQHNFPFGRSAYLNDKIYVTSYTSHHILIVSMEGEILETIGNGTEAIVDGPAATASFDNPNGIAVTPDESAIYIASGGGPVRKIIL